MLDQPVLKFKEVSRHSTFAFGQVKRVCSRCLLQPVLQNGLREADGKTARTDNKTNPALFAAPHALAVDSRGDFYVVEWVDFGRPRKFRHLPA